MIEVPGLGRYVALFAACFLGPVVLLILLYEIDRWLVGD